MDNDPKSSKDVEMPSTSSPEWKGDGNEDIFADKFIKAINEAPQPDVAKDDK